MLETYNDLNPASLDELFEEPSALEFMRYVAQNRPFIIRKGAADWTACRSWSPTYLSNVMGTRAVRVAVTPHGNADAVVDLPDHTRAFVEPFEDDLLFTTAMKYIIAHETDSTFVGPVKYCQTQNDNLREEYAPLFADVPKDIPFVRIALDKAPDAINFWLGNRRSKTSLHRDNYENIYAQVHGKKHFVLLPPLFAPCVQETQLPLARYHRTVDEDGREKFTPVVAEPEVAVPVPLWDPFTSRRPEGPLAEYVKPIEVDLEAGDMMYLPALWYHAVRQTAGEHGFSCSVNYWYVHQVRSFVWVSRSCIVIRYDMDFSGSFWSTNGLIRDLSAHLAPTADPINP